jgi:hypothetical protein
MAGKAAFLLASYRLRVSEDWVVETVDIELAAHHAVIELVSKSESGTGIFNAETRRKNRVMCRKFVSRDRASQKKLAHISLKLPFVRSASNSHPFSNLAAEQAAFWQSLLSFARPQRRIRAVRELLPQSRRLVEAKQTLTDFVNAGC